MSIQSCPGDSSNCQLHFHDEDPRYLVDTVQTHRDDDPEAGLRSTVTGPVVKMEAPTTGNVPLSNNESIVGFRRLICNFTPSYVKAFCSDLVDADEHLFVIDGSSSL
jgi:hypothetical protein